MTSEFNVHNAAGYEQLMGRWSQKLAPLFIDFAGVADGEKILDVGCGTGSLTFALAKAADLAEIAAIDYSPVFVEELLSRRLTIAACKDRPFRPQRDGGAAGTNADQSVPTEAWTGMSPESDDDHLH